MTALEWHKPGELRYETGVDRGVLYLPDGGAVAWNGLTSVSEKISHETKQYYIDGIPYLAEEVYGAYSATVQAYTYPDELDNLTGVFEYSPGVFLNDQRSRIFNMSYRTLVGNDIEGTDHGYKIHLLYNVLATLSDRAYETVGSDLSAPTLEWTLTGTPSPASGFRPTAHITLDSRRLPEENLASIEGILYGNDDLNPSLPGIIDFLNTINAM